MAGGLMQLVAYGAQDVYLTGNPQITFFKVVYRRHTNFSMECIEQTLNGNPDFSRRSTVTITRNGDLITKVYVQVKLNQVVLSQGSSFGWVRRLGHALLHSVEVEIGGSKIDKQYGVWLNIWWELARHAGQADRGYLKMIGDVPELTAYLSHDEAPVRQEYVMYIPLKFWFNRHAGLALPLIALQYHEVRLNIEFANVETCYVANAHFKQNDSKQMSLKDVQLLVDYIYLDSEERRRFAQVGHEYLIEQLQFTGTESAQTQTNKYKLDFNHPTKELVWCLSNGNFINGKAFVNYTGIDNWNVPGQYGFTYESSLKILKESMCLLNAVVNSNDQSGNPCSVLDGENPPTEGTWEEFCPNTHGTTSNGKITIWNNCDTKALWINTDSLKIGTYKITDKISADVTVDENCNISITNLVSSITVRDLSFPVSCMDDTRCTRDDPCVYEPWNCGVLLSGEGNPVQYGLLQLNGLDRFDRREGPYFNYVQPDQHHTNTPADGINVYSFALYPEQHQPSGTCNLSRIDNTQLNLWFFDPTWQAGLPLLQFINSENRLFIFAVNYNILRVMSGMGGLAYSN